MIRSASLLCALAVVLLHPVVARDLISPCPEIFEYERNATEPDRWYGTATVTSDHDLVGIWFRVLLDSDSLQLGNWFGGVESRDNNLGYLIKNPRYTLKANTPLTIKFFVRYDPSRPAPKIVSLRLNAVVKCPEGADFTSELPISTGELYTNKPGSSSSVDDASIVDDSCGGITKAAFQEGRVPWHAALYQAQNIDSTYVCGATLIGRQHLVTTAQCVTNKNSPVPVKTDGLLVSLGKFNLKDWKNPYIQFRSLDQIIVHPKYDPQGLANNIAVLKMARPIERTYYVRPVCFWEGATDLGSLVNQIGSVVGWGFDEKGSKTGQLINSDATIASAETCTTTFPEHSASDSTFCAASDNGTSVCNGDAGGSLVIPRAGSDPNNPVWQIRGLVHSVSVPLQNRVTCDPARYAVFTDVTKYSDFIKGSLKL